VLGLAAGHHRGRGELLRFDLTDDGAGLPAHRVEHQVDEPTVGRNDGQAVGPPLLVTPLDVVEDVHGQPGSIS
jgi:hypothetical protein